MTSIRIRLHRGLVAWMLASALAACGGNVVVDRIDTGAGGSTSSATVTTGSGATGGIGGSGGFGGDGGFAGGGGGSPCEILGKALIDDIDAAQECNGFVNEPECSGTVVIFDLCGCEIVANDNSYKLAGVAINVFDEWVAQGCGPYDCRTCPPPPSSPWYCDTTNGKCQPGWQK